MSVRVQLLVVSPETVIYQGEALWLQIPLADGLLGVWPDHAPLIASLAAGIVEYATESGVQQIELDGGTLRIDAERCVLLVGAPDDLGLLEDHVALFDRAARVLDQEMEDTQREEVGL